MGGTLYPHCDTLVFFKRDFPFQNEPVIEFDRSPNPLRERLLAEPITLIGGRVPVPQGPGLGIAVDESALKEYECGGSADKP